jgi:hypothetical protein
MREIHLSFIYDYIINELYMSIINISVSKLMTYANYAEIPQREQLHFNSNIL